MQQQIVTHAARRVRAETLIVGRGYLTRWLAEETIRFIKQSLSVGRFGGAGLRTTAQLGGVDHGGGLLCRAMVG